MDCIDTIVIITAGIGVVVDVLATVEFVSVEAIDIDVVVSHYLVAIIADVDAIVIAVASYLSDQAPDEVLHEDEAEHLPRPKAVRLLHDDTIRLVEMP